MIWRVYSIRKTGVSPVWMQKFRWVVSAICIQTAMCQSHYRICFIDTDVLYTVGSHLHNNWIGLSFGWSSWVSDCKLKSNLSTLKGIFSERNLMTILRKCQHVLSSLFRGCNFSYRPFHCCVSRNLLLNDTQYRQVRRVYWNSLPLKVTFFLTQFSHVILYQDAFH